MDTFWARTLFLMSQNNISQVDLGNHVGKSKGTVNSWIKRDVIPAGDICLKIAELLDTTLPYLVTGKLEREFNPLLLKLNKIIGVLPEERILDIIRLAEGWLPEQKRKELFA